MSKVSYLLGAGASYGSREKPADETFSSLPNYISRGLPILQEFPYALEQLSAEIESIDGYSVIRKAISSNVLNPLLSVSRDYPTVDTYAKMLNATQRSGEYEKFKEQLSLFFLIWQRFHKHDLRYDSFIASLIDAETCQFPPLTILSWNYDMQFEMSYSNYITEGRALWKIWDQLNVYCKSNGSLNYNANNPFAFFKLNGSAMYHATAPNKYTLRYTLVDLLWSEASEESFWNDVYTLFDKGKHKNLHAIPEYANELSYAWDKWGKEKLLENITQRITDCEVLVVIGYSFPYVNREIDRHIFNSMPNLKKIYVQDKQAKNIGERVKYIYEYLNKPIPFIVPKDDVSNFFIPNELG